MASHTLSYKHYLEHKNGVISDMGLKIVRCLSLDAFRKPITFMLFLYVPFDVHCMTKIKLFASASTM